MQSAHCGGLTSPGGPASGGFPILLCRWAAEVRRGKGGRCCPRVTQPQARVPACLAPLQPPESDRKTCVSSHETCYFVPPLPCTPGCFLRFRCACGPLVGLVSLWTPALFLAELASESETPVFLSGRLSGFRLAVAQVPVSIALDDACALCSVGRVRLSVAHQTPLSLGALQARMLQLACHALLRGIFPTQGLSPGLPHCRLTLYHLSHQGSPDNTYMTEHSHGLLIHITVHSQAQSRKYLLKFPLSCIIEYWSWKREFGGPFTCLPPFSDEETEG